MIQLFRIFAGIVLKVTAIYIVASIVGILMLDKLFGGYEFYIGMIVFIAPLISWALTFMAVPKNLDWIMALPISKRNIVLLNYATNVFSSICIFSASLFVLVFLAIVKADKQVSVVQVARAAPTLIPRETMAGVDIYGWMTGLLMLSFFHALSMSISRPAATKRLFMNLWNHLNPLWRWAFRTSWVFLVGLAALSREFLLSPFGVFIIATVAFLFLTTVNTCFALGISRVQRRRWIAAAAIVVAIQIGFLYAHAMSGVRSESFDRRVASVMFLGAFSGGLAKADLAKLLEAEINRDRLEELGEMYRKRYHGGGRIRSINDVDVSFRRAVESKRGYAEVLAAVRLFAPEELAVGDLQAFFAKVQPLAAECHCEVPLHELLEAKLDAEGAQELLESGVEAAEAFALLWMRYRAADSQARLATAVERRIPQLSDRLKLSALMTLSVLGGRRYEFRDWMERKGRKLAYFAGAPDCAAFAERAKHSLGSADMAPLNYCLRAKAEPSAVSELESIGWIELPLDSKTRALMRRILRLK